MPSGRKKRPKGGAVARLGRYLRAQREALGKTQGEIAALLPIDQSYVSHIELGRQNPADLTLGFLASYARALELPLLHLLVEGGVLDDLEAREAAEQTAREGEGVRAARLTLALMFAGDTPEQAAAKLAAMRTLSATLGGAPPAAPSAPPRPASMPSPDGAMPGAEGPEGDGPGPFPQRW